VSDPLFNLNDIQIDTPIEVYKKIEPGIHYVTPTDENAVLEENEGTAWVEGLKEDAQIWEQGGWGIR
jgi:hypothetical protein